MRGARAAAAVAIAGAASGLYGCGLLVGFDDLAPPDAGRDAAARRDAPVDATLGDATLGDATRIDGARDAGEEASPDARDAAPEDAPPADAISKDAGGCDADLDTDPDHCGSCIMHCDLRAGTTQPCVVGQCAVVTLWQQEGAAPISLATDDASVYWTNRVSGTVLTTSLDGGAAVTLTMGEFGETDVVVDSSNVYWLSVMGLRRHSKSPNDAAATTIDPNAVHATSLIAGDGFLVYPEGTGASVLATPDGGSPTTLPGIASSNSYVALSGDNLYWIPTGADAGSIFRTSLGGGGVETLASGFNDPTGLGVVDVAVGFSGSGFVFLLSLGASFDGGADGGIESDAGRIEVLAPTAPGNSHIVLDETYAYFASGPNLVKVPLGGGAVTTICAGTAPTDIVSTPLYVYWVDEAAGALMRARKAP